MGSDWWSWVALACGLVAIGGALVTGVGAIEPWLQTTVHRVTEFSALAGWWIVAMWAVVAAAAPSWSAGGAPFGPTTPPRWRGRGRTGSRRRPRRRAHGGGGRMNPGPTAT